MTTKDEGHADTGVPFSHAQLLELHKAMLLSGDPIMKVFAKAWLMQFRKGQDYNQHSRDAYWPFGVVSFTQMLHVKVQRLISLSSSKNHATNFESIEDTGYDLINYAAFMVEWLERQKK
jgi:hypothetical protein